MLKNLTWLSLTVFLSTNTLADSFDLSANGSTAISNGALEMSAGALQIVTGVLSAPVTVTGGGAEWSTQQRTEGGDLGVAPLPIADEIVKFTNVAD